MARTIRINKSNKRGFNGQENHIVTRGRTSYLRIVGNDPNYSLMTATASEDDSSYSVCGDRAKLISSALRLCAKIGSKPSPDKDTSGREFIYICGITFIPDKEQEDLEELYSVLESFFHIYDTCDLTSSNTVGEMQEIYSAIAPDESNGDVYLSDGMWLSSDGQLHDRGR